jgi:hypothetical protein
MALRPAAQRLLALAAAASTALASEGMSIVAERRDQDRDQDGFDVFISYSRTNADWVRTLDENLRRAGRLARPAVGRWTRTPWARSGRGSAGGLHLTPRLSRDRRST